MARRPSAVLEYMWLEVRRNCDTVPATSQTVRQNDQG
jgi:hypothetical protein